MFKKTLTAPLILTVMGISSLSFSAIAMNPLEEERQKLSKKTSGERARHLQDSKSKEIESNKVAVKALDKLLWNQSYDDAKQDSPDVRTKRDKLFDALKEKNIKKFMKKYYRDNNNEDFDQTIYLDKDLVNNVTTEGQWKAPTNMREAIGLLSSEDVEAVFDEEGLS